MQVVWIISVKRVTRVNIVKKKLKMSQVASIKIVTG